MLCDNLAGGVELHDGGGVCVPVADSYASMAEHSTTL